MYTSLSRRSGLAYVVGILLVFPLAAGANVIGTDAQNFNPTTDGLDFVTVQSSETLLPGVINIGAFWNEAWNALPRFKGQPEYRDRLLGMDLNLGVGLLDRWDAGISVPSVLDQSVSSQSGFAGRYGENGFTEIKLNTKYRLSGELDGGFALVASTNINLIRNNPYVGEGAGPTFNLEAVYDHTFGKVAAAVNAGYRFRKSGTQIPGIPIQPFKNQWIASVAGNYLVDEWDTKVIGEIFGSFPASSTNDDSDRQATSLEALLGLKHDFTTNLAGHFGVGRELASGLSSPDFRVYVGLNYQFGPIFSEHAEVMEDLAGHSAILDPKAKEEKFALRKIQFAFNSAELSPSSRPILDELAGYLKKNGFATLTIEGHTDSIGSDAYNLKLSNARANTIRNDLIKTYGFDGGKIVSIGYGESRPIADNGNYQGRELNRRVEFKITRGKN
ncbi:MAG: OmpA family protein [Bdellovibrionales bacterium]|nr:OmpA family protein [Bdellovibrionales bacterium]